MTDRYKWDLPLTGTQSTKVRLRRFRYGMWLYDVRQLPPRLMRASTERLDRREVRQASVRDSAMSACAGFAWRLSLQLRVFAPLSADGRVQVSILWSMDSSQLLTVDDAHSGKACAVAPLRVASRAA